jgi:hypothetical protein
MKANISPSVASPRRNTAGSHMNNDIDFTPSRIRTVPVRLRPTTGIAISFFYNRKKLPKATAWVLQMKCQFLVSAEVPELTAVVSLVSHTKDPNAPQIA